MRKVGIKEVKWPSMYNGIQVQFSVDPKAFPFLLGCHFSTARLSSSSDRTSYLPLYLWWNLILQLLNQRKPGLTMLFLSAFWIVYPVMAAFPSSFGGVHDRATFSPHTSSIFTTWGGPGRSIEWNHSITARWLSFPTNTLVQEDILKRPSPPCISIHICFITVPD